MIRRIAPSKLAMPDGSPVVNLGRTPVMPHVVACAGVTIAGIGLLAAVRDPASPRPAGRPARAT